MVVMLDTPCSEVECKTTGYPLHSHVPLHFPYRASPCAIRFPLSSTSLLSTQVEEFSDSTKIYGNGTRGFRTSAECNPFAICEPVYKIQSDCWDVSIARNKLCFVGCSEYTVLSLFHTAL